jgi:mannosyltransferase
MNKILYDNIIFSLQNNGGISVYWYELCQRLIQDNRFNKYFLNHQDLNKLGINLEIDKKYLIKQELKYFNNIIMPNVKLEKHIFHSSYYRFNKNANAINITTIHDFIHLKKFNCLRKYKHKIFKDFCINNSDFFIAISENTKKDFLHYYPHIDKNKITVIYNGVSDDFYKITNNSTQKFISEKEYQKYFLFVGSRYGYKNFIPLVKSLESFIEFNLYIVGDNLTKIEINYLNKYLKNRWKIFTDTTNVQLNILYNNSFCLIYPSSYEGFGIPIIESMKSGAPVIALNNSSIPEVAGNAGIIIDNLSPVEIGNAIFKIHTNRQMIVNSGFLQSSLFSWNICYKKTTDLYLKYLN